jgi:hypothetical protein
VVGFTNRPPDHFRANADPVGRDDPARPLVHLPHSCQHRRGGALLRPRPPQGVTPSCHSERSEESLPRPCHSERSEESLPRPCHSERSEESLPRPCHSERSEESLPPPFRAAIKAAPTFLAINPAITRFGYNPVGAIHESPIARSFPSRFPPRGIAAAVGAKNMPPACFLNVPTRSGGGIHSRLTWGESLSQPCG